MNERPITVLITCIGSPMGVELLRALSERCTLPTRVVGVDVVADAVGKRHADAFHTVPPGDDPAYPERLLEVCRREGVQVVIPGSDEEALSLAGNLDPFREAGVVCTVPREELIGPFSDKAAMFDWLQERGVPVPRFFRVGSPRELTRAAESLGYPERPFVIKPIASRGGRGVWEVRDGGCSLPELLGGVSLDAITLETFLSAMERSGEGGEGGTPPLMAMEHLEGDVFDVDILARHGETLYLIPRHRYHPRTMPFRGCYLEEHEGVLALSRRIQAALALHYLHDFDIMLSADGAPHLLEVNPRVSGSVVATVSAGINLIEFLVRMALDLEIPEVEIPYGTAIKPSVRVTAARA